MVKKIIEGIQILPSPPAFQGAHKEPVVRLDDGLVLSDRVFECPTLLVGPVGSGKSFLLERMMEPILQNAAQMNENVFIFCAKKDAFEQDDLQRIFASGQVLVYNGGQNTVFIANIV